MNLIYSLTTCRTGDDVPMPTVTLHKTREDAVRSLLEFAGQEWEWANGPGGDRYLDLEHPLYSHAAPEDERQADEYLDSLGIVFDIDVHDLTPILASQQTH